MTAPRSHRLSRVGYWFERDESPSEWPDPRELVVEWRDAQKARVLQYLADGRERALYLGCSYCRFGCEGRNGSADLWDGTFVWPEGLAHYVAEHSVGLPDSFVRHMEANGFCVPATPVPEMRDEDATDFLRWAASQAPPPIPRDGTLSAVEARARAATLSTSRTAFAVEEFCGRWHLTGEGLDTYLPPLTQGELDERLLPHRVADSAIGVTEANEIAARLAGPDLAVKFTGWGNPGRWYVATGSALRQRSQHQVATDALGVEAFVRSEREAVERFLAKPFTAAEAQQTLFGAIVVEELVRGDGVAWRFSGDGIDVEYPRPDRRRWDELRSELFREHREAKKRP